MSPTPKIIFVFSGKRKSGKDYITELLQKRLGKDKCAILRLSAPLKAQYAKEHNLDFQKLLDASEYKEKYRSDMIVWGEEKRNKDPGFFCRATTSGPDADSPVWLISDARRKSDVAYFKQNFNKITKTVRVQAKDSVRVDRGFVFTSGVDDAESECGLDDAATWDIMIDNNGDQTQLQAVIEEILVLAQSAISIES